MAATIGDQLGLNLPTSAQSVGLSATERESLPLSGRSGPYIISQGVS